MTTLHSSRIPGLIVMLAAAWLGSCRAKEGPSCEICARAQICSLLPSPLGTDMDNCQRRCELSKKSEANVYQTVRGCSDDAGSTASAGSTGGPWCGDNSECAVFAQCLRGKFPEAGVEGIGSVQITLLAGDSADAADAGESEDADSEVPACLARDLPKDNSGDKSACERIGVTRATLLLRTWTGELLTSRAQSCEAALGTPVAFASVVPGLLQPGALLEGTIPDDSAAGGAPNVESTSEAGAGGAGSEGGARVVRPSYCRIAWGVPTGLGAVARSGATTPLWVALPTRREVMVPEGRVLACEDDLTQCHDGLDNDWDTRRDCEDPKCASYCADGGTGGRGTDPDAGGGNGGETGQAGASGQE